MTSQVLLASLYLPPVSYFHTILNSPNPIFIEQYEHFQKQSYRSRTRIATANGIQDLIVPIQHGRKERVPFKDIRISYEFDWQRLHWMGLQSAYRSSAYFEYYEDDFAPFYKQKETFLLDLNMKQLQLILKSLKIKNEVLLTDSYQTVFENIVDYREIIHPKKPAVMPETKPYYQVFSDKNGFFPELSIVDLLFNQGPQSKNYL